MPRFSPFLNPRYIFEFLGFLLIRVVFLPLPVRMISSIGGFLGRRLGPKLKGHQTARKNLGLAMPDIPPDAQTAILLSMWENLGRTSFEYLSLARISRNHQRHLSFDIAPETEALIKQDNARIVFFSAHFANWELMPLILTLRNIPTAEMYRPPNNPYIDWWLTRLRRKAIAPFQLAKNNRSARALLRHIKNGHAFAMLIDQFTHGGLPANFFGQQALTNDVLAVLHLRYHYELVPASLTRDANTPHFTLRIEPPLKFSPSGDYKKDALTLTQNANDMLESMVRKNPGQWLWMHRRWGHLRGRSVPVAPPKQDQA